jgi:signal recognition particle receptor subunit beta
MTQSAKVLRWLLQDVEDFKGSDVFLLVLCNKQDAEDALSMEEVAEKLKVDELCGGGEEGGGRAYKLMPTVASNGSGIFDVVNTMTRYVVAHRNR